jgi:hypothetical protein
MELTDEALLKLILTPVRKTTARRAPSRRTTTIQGKTGYQPPAAKSGLRRCNCSVCATCLENARWERIFREKFADPEYYRQPLRRGSSLNW